MDSSLTFIQKKKKKKEISNNHYTFPRKGRESYKNTRGVYRIKTLEVYII